ncbi:MAG: hypothetical protein WB660_05715 [Candidatus Sulfotelmatobacter sp.]
MEYFGRTPFARQPFEYDEVIPSIPEGPVVDDNSPLSSLEVRFHEDESARHRSIHLDWHTETRELEIVAGYCSVTRETLNFALHETEGVHGPVKTLAVTLATQNARAHALFFVKMGFTRSQDRSRNTWTYVSDVEEHRAKKKERKPRAKPVVVDVKNVPRPEIKSMMTFEEFQGKQAELDALRKKIAKLEGQS